MDDKPQAQGGELERLAKAAKLEPFTTAERELLMQAPAGNWAKCGPKHAATDTENSPTKEEDADPHNDPKDADKWGKERRIRAELLAWLCINDQARKRVHPRGIQVYGADITGPLDLSFVKIPFPLTLWHCRVQKEIDLSRAEVSELDLEGSSVQGITADGLVVKNNLFLRNGFTAKGEVLLIGAQIGGQLDCSGGSFVNEGGKAINADGVDVKGSVFLTKGSDAQGKETPFTAKGEVNLIGAQIGSNLECDAGTFVNEGGKAIAADGVNVNRYVFLKNVTAKGEVRLVGAQIGNNLECDAGTFVNEGGNAINADGVDVKGSVFLRKGSDAQGKETPFTAKGEVNLVGAQIGRTLECAGGVFTNPTGYSLGAERAIVKSSVFLIDGFKADGWVDLSGAQIGGDFDCSGGDFQEATLNLTDASAATLRDSGLNDPQGSAPTIWPQPGELLLDGFNYGRISSVGRVNVENRRGWLARQPQSPFHPRPYLQLAKVLRESGDDKGAQTVLIEMEARSRKGSIWSPVLKYAIGYGYDPIRALGLAAILTGVGWVVYRRSYLAGGMVPTDKDACDKFCQPGAPVPEHYPSFSPLVYSVENSLPLVKLGQGNKWQPDPERQGAPMQTRSATEFGYRIKWTWLPDKLRSFWQALSRGLAAIWSRAPKWLQNLWAWISATTTAPRFVMWFLWFQILLGWLLATLFLAGVSGIVHKE